MGRNRIEETLMRRWRIIELLERQDDGVTVRWLVQQVRASQATVYRDIQALRHAGVPLDLEPFDGEVRYRLLDGAGEDGHLTRLQHAALCLVRDRLRTLDGTGLVAELDALMDTGS